MWRAAAPVSIALQRIARSGYASDDVWAEHLILSGRDPTSLARRARDLGLALTVHAPP